MPILRSVVGWGLSLVVLGVEEGSRTPSHPPLHRSGCQKPKKWPTPPPEKEDHITWESDHWNPDEEKGTGEAG